MNPHPPTSPGPASPDALLLAFLSHRSVPCPRCAYDLRNISSPLCPECGEPLILKVGSPRPRFGWLIVAFAPGCFSGVMAVFVLIPIFASIVQGSRLGGNVPWPIVAADLFGFLSAAAVAIFYFHRHHLLALPSRRQAAFAAIIWGVHVLALALVLLSMWYWY